MDGITPQIVALTLRNQDIESSGASCLRNGRGQPLLDDRAVNAFWQIIYDPKEVAFPLSEAGRQGVPDRAQ